MAYSTISTAAFEDPPEIGAKRIRSFVREYGRELLPPIKAAAEKLGTAKTPEEWFEAVGDLCGAILPLTRYDAESARPRRARKLKIIERDSGRCVACGESDPLRLQVDHLFPAPRGGSILAWNLTTLCVSCNAEKGSGIVYWAILLMIRQLESAIEQDEA